MDQKQKVAIRRITSEYKKSLGEEFYSIAYEESNVFDCVITLHGPPGTPYENGKFKLQFQFPKDYPWTPPTVQFLTKVYHPNVDYNTGEICLSLLDKDNKDETAWRPAHNISSVMVSIQSFFMDPNVDDPMNPRIAAEFRSHRDKFEDMARKWTKKYAIDGEVFNADDWVFENYDE